VFALPAAAQDETLLASAATDPNASSDINSDVLPKKEAVPPPDPKLELRLNLGIDSLLKDIRPVFPDYWSTYANQPNHIYRTHYRGLHGVIHDQIFHQINRYHKKYFKELLQNSSLHPVDLESRLRNYRTEASDSQYRWWEKKKWFDYYPVSKGGSELRVHVVGCTRTVLSLGPLDVTNTGKVSLSRWRLTIDRVEDDDGPVDRDIINTDIRNTKSKTINDRPIQGRNFSLGIKPPKGNIYTGDNWTLSGSVKVNVKFNLDRDNGTALRGQLKLLGYTRKKLPWLQVALRVSAKPLRNQYSAQLVFTLLTF